MTRVATILKAVWDWTARADGERDRFGVEPPGGSGSGRRLSPAEIRRGK